MNKFRILLITFSLIMLPNFCLAKEVTINKTDFILIRNPFESQLPKEEPLEVSPTPQPIIVPPKPKPPQKTEPLRRKDREDKKDLPKPPKPEVVLPDITISGLIWNTPRPQAIVDGEVVDIGDTIGTFKIVAIEKNGIDIAVNGQKVRLAP